MQVDPLKVKEALVSQEVQVTASVQAWHPESREEQVVQVVPERA